MHSKAIEALIKPVGVVQGASDVTFHRTATSAATFGCSGGQLRISVTGGTEANGRLRVVAGSHRVAMPVEIARTGDHLRSSPSPHRAR